LYCCNIATDFSNFTLEIAGELKKGIGRALADAVILEPNFAGMGFSFKKMIEYFKNK
jgi:hypothetical protein